MPIKRLVSVQNQLHLLKERHLGHYWPIVEWFQHDPDKIETDVQFVLGQLYTGVYVNWQTFSFTSRVLLVRVQVRLFENIVALAIMKRGDNYGQGNFNRTDFGALYLGY